MVDDVNECKIENQQTNFLKDHRMVIVTNVGWWSLLWCFVVRQGVRTIDLLKHDYHHIRQN